MAGVGGSDGFAHDLAELVAALRSIDTRGRVFDRPGRGGDLRFHDEWVQTCLRHSEPLLDVPRLRRLWQTCASSPARLRTR